MGRKPRQEPVKEYLENPRTTWLFSSPHQFYECFGDSDIKYLTQAGKGNRLGKETYRIVLHFPNKYHNDRDAYLDKMRNSSTFGRYFNTDLGYSRIRWDSGSNPSAQLILHDKKGRRQEFFLTPSKHDKGALINATTSFPTLGKKWKPLKANTKAKDAVKDANGNMGKWIQSEKLVLCPVRVGSLDVSASKPGQIKLTRQKPKIECGKRLTQAGKSPTEFQKKDKVKTAENEMESYMSEEDICAFYEAQGLPNLLEIQDVEIMDSETQNQEHERQYYNPSDAMVGNETLEGYAITDSTTVDLTSNQPTANYGAEGKKMMCASCGSHNVKYAEGETATYAPSEEPDMVSSSDFDNPTNADFSAEGEVEESVAPVSEPVAVAEGTSLNGYAPIDSLEEGAPIGHGVNQYFGSAEGVEGALMDESTTNITVEEGVSLEGFSGVDSVVVEAPLGHCVTQWFAEGDNPEPQFDDGITGQDGPSDNPTNSDFHSENHLGQGYDDEMDESLGMRHRGMHEQSFKDRRDEASAMDKMHSKMGRKYDDVMAMDAEINRWHDKQTGQFTGKWSKHRGNGEFKTHNADTAGYLQDGSLSMDGYTPLESVEVDRSSYQPTQNYGAEFDGEGILGDSPMTYAAKGAFGLGVGTLLFGASLAAIASIGAMIQDRNGE